MGIASHLGLLLDLPAIGCAKSRLIGSSGELGLEKGSASPLLEDGQTIGRVVRTRTQVNPVFVSPGHKIGFTKSRKIVLSLCRGYRIPEPLRQAHWFVNSIRKSEVNR